MGWSSGTEIFEEAAKIILGLANTRDYSRMEALKDLIILFEEHDCELGENGIDYFKDQSIRRALKEVHPDWFEEE